MPRDQEGELEFLEDDAQRNCKHGYHRKQTEHKPHEVGLQELPHQ